MAGRFYLLMGPSAGTGKTTLERELAKLPGMAVAVSHTTRPMREGEVNGVHYHFVDVETYLGMKAAGDFVETNEVPQGSGKYYGLSRTEVVDKLAQGDLITVVDRYGYFDLRDQFDCCVLFTVPPMMGGSVNIIELAYRMHRQGRTDDVIRERLAGIDDEMKSLAHATYFIDSGLPLDRMIDQARFMVECDRRKRGLEA